MSDYHPNLDGPAEPIGLAMDSQERRAHSELASARGYVVTLAMETGTRERAAKLLREAADYIERGYKCSEWRDEGRRGGSWRIQETTTT